MFTESLKMLIRMTVHTTICQPAALSLVSGVRMTVTSSSDDLANTLKSNDAVGTFFFSTCSLFTFRITVLTLQINKMATTVTLLKNPFFDIRLMHCFREMYLLRGKYEAS